MGKKLERLLVAIVCMAILVGCELGQNQGFKAIPTNNIDNPNEDLKMAPFDVNRYALNKVVCDPLGGATSNPGIQDGLTASLFYLGAGQEQYRNVNQYIEMGIASSQNLFFSTLEVPTRRFELGFPSETGTPLENDQGEVLNEWFGIRFNSNLKLAEGDDEGLYELAILADDGVIMKIKDEDHVFRTVVDNDHHHPTRMGCGDTIDMSYGNYHEVEIDYYQGPRYHIALIPMWRKVDESTPFEPLCGEKGNSLFFDFKNNSDPQQAYLDLLDRGWKPIQAENWGLPDQAGHNPCTQGEVPEMLNFRLAVKGDAVVTLTWETNIPATSQVLYEDTVTGEEIITTSDNLLRTNHEITLNGVLKVGRQYIFRAVSISETYGKGISDPIPHVVR